MSETQAEFDKEKAFEQKDFSGGSYYLLMALYEQNKTIISLLKQLKSTRGKNK